MLFGSRCGRFLPARRRRAFLDVPPNGLVAFAGSRLEAALVDDLDVPAVIADEPACCSILATTVTVVRRTPSICDKNSCVSLMLLLSSRSRACSNQRLRRASTGCSALQAAVC